MAFYSEIRSLENLLSKMLVHNVNPDIFILFENRFKHLSNIHQQRIYHNKMYFLGICPEYFEAYKNFFGEQDEVLSEYLQSSEILNSQFFEFKLSREKLYFQEEKDEQEEPLVITHRMLVKSIFFDKKDAAKYINYYSKMIHMGCECEKFVNAKIEVFQKQFIEEHPEYSNILIPFYLAMDMENYEMNYSRNSIVERFIEYLEICNLDTQ